MLKKRMNGIMEYAAIAVLGIMLVFVLTFLISAGVGANLLPEKLIGFGGKICLFFGCVFAGGAAAKRKREGQGRAAVITGFFIYFAVFVAGIISRKNGVWDSKLLINLAIVLSGVLSGCIIFGKKRIKKRIKR